MGAAFGWGLATSGLIVQIRARHEFAINILDLTQKMPDRPSHLKVSVFGNPGLPGDRLRN